MFSLKCFTLCIADLNKQTTKFRDKQLVNYSEGEQSAAKLRGAHFGDGGLRELPRGTVSQPAVALAGFIAAKEPQTHCCGPRTPRSSLARLGGQSHGDQSSGFL